ncbi:MAG: glycosyltransferase [Polyangiaceae bacterium]
MERKLRVLFLNDTSRNGGPGRSLFYILRFLDTSRIHRAVVLPRPGVISEMYRTAGVADELFFEHDLVENPVEPASRAMVREDFDAPLGVRASRLVVNVMRGARGILRLRRRILLGPYDLIYCNGTNACFAGGALARMTGVPALWHVRYTSVPKALTDLHTKLASHPNVARIVCVSNASASLFPSQKDKVRVIHNALDPADFDTSSIVPLLRKELRLPADTIVFGSQGRILPRKGYVEMIHAAKQMLERLSPSEKGRAHFAVLGDTPDDIQPDHLAECRALVEKLGLEKQFTFLGFRSNVAEYASDFDVAVVPSTYADPLPRAVIESMALGKPVVAFDVGGVGEMLQHGVTGTLISGSPPDVSALGEAFFQYFHDADRRAREGRAGRAHIEREYDARIHGERIQAQIFEAVADKGRQSKS